MTVKFANIPEELQSRAQWVLWQWEERSGKDTGEFKWTKPPYQPNGISAESDNPNTWVSFEEAKAAYERGGFSGVGYVVTVHSEATDVHPSMVDDGITGVDLDHVVDPDTGTIEDWAQSIVDRLDSYTESSPSGTGLRIFLFAKLPPKDRKLGGFECYESGRYLTVTGNHLPGTPATIEHRQNQMTAVHTEMFAERNRNQPKQGPPPKAAPVDLEDEVLLEVAFAAKNGDAVRRLYDGDIGAYGSHSEADLALCSHLAFYTAGDRVRLDRMFRASDLWRPKWDGRRGSATYGELTIGKALDGAREFYTGHVNGQCATGGSHQADSGKRKSQATLLVGLAEDAELWHTPEYDAFATIEVDGHKENYSFRSSGFKRWLSHRFYGQVGTVPNAQAIQDALSVINGKAVYEGPEHTVFTRLAGYDGRIYLDLANSTWEAVEVTDTGWQVIATPPVKFRRQKGMLPLPAPMAGGNIESLRSLVNVRDRVDWTLLLAWLVAALRPTGPYPILVLHGEQGSAKSTLARVLRAFIDPNTAPLRSEPKEPRDLMIAATNSWCMALDNISHLPVWLSDAVCRLSTGGGFATRTLYENDEETIFDAQRPIILNGIDELAVRGDLLDRAIILYLPKIEEAERREEKRFWAEFESARPIVLGGLLDAVSLGLRDVDQVQLPRLPRMADFAIWSVAAAPALGFSQEAFVDAYSTNRDSANELTLESSTLVPPLRAMVANKGGWMGSATDLLGELDKRADERTKRQKGWPSNARALSNALRRLTHNLRVDGIDVTFDREKDKARRRIITITQVEGIYRPPASNRPTEGMPDTNPNLPSDGKPNHEDANDGGSVHISVRNSVSEKGSSDSADDTDARILGLSKDVLEVE